MQSPIFRFDAWLFDPNLGMVQRPGRDRVKLTPREIALLQAFLAYPRQVLTRQFLVTAMYGEHPPAQGYLNYAALTVQVCRLRDKIERSYADAPIIRTVRGGYWFCPTPVVISVGAI